jgi:SAM-dependent methyltransferase
MKPRTLASLARSGQGSLQLALMRLSLPFYRAAFLATAAAHGVLARLAGGPVPFEALATDLCPETAARDGLQAWLQLGVQLGALAYGPAGYSLRGRLAKQLADPANDGAAALLQEMVSLHHRFIVETPLRSRQGRKFGLNDQDGELIARSSRILEPFVREAIDAAVPRRGPCRLLEVGCGTGVYIRYAAARNPQLTALGLELQPAVAELAQRNLRGWQLADRATVETGDVRARRAEAVFDLVTLHNNIYYFPVGKRVGVLTHLRGFLRPGGMLLLTTGCQGGGAAMEVLNLWAAMTEGCGRLPARTELIGQLAEAGYQGVKATTLIPGAGFCAFTARAPA